MVSTDLPYNWSMSKLDKTVEWSIMGTRVMYLLCVRNYVATNRE